MVWTGTACPGRSCLDVGKAAGVVCGRQERVYSIFIWITSIESSFLLKGVEKSRWLCACRKVLLQLIAVFAKDCVHKGRRSSPFVAMPVYFGYMCFSVFSVAAIRPDTLRDTSGSICSVFVSIQHFIIVIFQWSLVAFYPDCFNQHLCSVLALLCLLPSCLFKHHWIFSSEIFMLIASVTSGIHSKRKAGIQFNGSEEECAEGGNISFSLGDAAQGTELCPRWLRGGHVQHWTLMAL